MKPLVVLALDISKRRTGWAVGGADWRRPIWGTHEIVGDWARREGHHLHSWREFLIETIERHQVNYIAMERFFIDMRDFDFNGTVPIAQMHGVVIELAEARKIRCGDADIKSWRQRFLGTAVAPKGMPADRRRKWWKELAVKACVARNWYVTHDDEAEAIGILDFTLAALDEDYAHRVGPAVRRQEWKREQAVFRGEDA